MKTLLLTLLIMFYITPGVAQIKLNVPAPVTSKFSTDYPNVEPAWSVAEGNYSADYTDQNTNLRRIITYDKNGALISTNKELNGTNYPPAIDDYYVKNHPSENYKVWLSEDNAGVTSYYCPRKGDKTLWFDKDGKYMSNVPRK